MERLRDELRRRERLRRAVLGAARAPPRGVEAPLAPFARAARTPEREGPLLRWRERFTDADWASGEGYRLFGARAGCPSAMLAALAAAGLDAASLVFVDLETCGLADAPIFLAGTLSAAGGGWELEQLLAPDPSAEPALLERCAALLGRRSSWLSFNGRSFDVPRLRRRSKLHGIELAAAAEHRDLLREVRRRWKGELPDCRLATVEERLLGLERDADIPGREVPERYWDFVHSRERRWIDPVVEHNRRDVAALAALLLRLLERDGS
jgi:uncharacterized protein YprB with RNaseH-like and TPR domain